MCEILFYHLIIRVLIDKYSGKKLLIYRKILIHRNFEIVITGDS